MEVMKVMEVMEVMLVINAVGDDDEPLSDWVPTDDELAETSTGKCKRPRAEEEEVEALAVAPPKAKSKTKHVQAPKKPDMDSTNLNQLLSGKTEAAKMKAKVQLTLAQAKLNDSGDANFNRERHLKNLDAKESE